MRKPLLAALLGLSLGVTAAGQASNPFTSRLLKIPPSAINQPAAVGVDSERNLVYITSDQVPAVAIYDAAKNTIARVSLPSSALRVAVNSTTGRAYLTSGGRNIYVVTPEGSVTSVAVSTATEGIAVDEGTNRVYVGDQADGSLREIDGSNNRVLNTYSLGRQANAIAVDGARHVVYAAVTGSVVRLDARTGKMDSVSFPNIGSSLTMPLADVAVNAKTGAAYVLGRAGFNGNNGYLHLMDGSTIPGDQNLVATAAPGFMTLDPNTNRLYLTDARNHSVNVLDLTARKFLTQIAIPQSGITEGPIGVAVNAKTGSVYATMRYIDGDPYLVVIDGK